MKVEPLSTPQEAEAERELIGCALNHPEIVDRADVGPDDFHMLPNREIWGTMRRMRNEGKPIDPVTVHCELGERVKAVGGLAYLSKVYQDAAIWENWRYYEGRIQEASLTRRIKMALYEVISSEERGEALLQAGMETVMALVGKKAEGAAPIPDRIRRGFQRACDALDGKLSDSSIKTGLGSLDELCGGLKRGVVTIVAGYTSMGKSSLARTIAKNIAAAGHGVHVFSLEDSGDSYADRLLAEESSIPLQRLRTMRLQKSDVGALGGAANRLFACTNWILDDSAALSAAQIAMRVRRHKQEIKTTLVVVDYVQLMRELHIKRGDKKSEVEAAAEALVELARKENVAVLLLSQLSRDHQRRDDKKPQLSDLRETGVLEQVADAVMFVYRHELYCKPEEQQRYQGRAEVLVRKNKNGPTGTADLFWDAECASFRNTPRASYR